MTLSPATFRVYLCCRLRLAVVPCLQYPDGDLQSFQIYRMNIERLREVIADAQPPPFPTAFLKPKVTLGARSSPPGLANRLSPSLCWGTCWLCCSSRDLQEGLSLT